MSQNTTTAARRTPTPQGTSNKPGQTTGTPTGETEVQRRRRVNRRQHRSTGLPVGPPPIQLDEKRVGDLAFRGLTDTAIGTMLGVDPGTIVRHCADLCRKKRIERKLAIRDQQMKILLSVDKWGQPTRGAATMAIWLGKQELGQTDKAQIGGDVSIKVEIKDYDGPGGEAAGNVNANTNAGGDGAGDGDGDGG